MPTTCEIIFENSPELVYYGGQLLSGRVEVTLTSSKTLRGTICFKILFGFSLFFLFGVHFRLWKLWRFLLEFSNSNYLETKVRAKFRYFAECGDFQWITDGVVFRKLRCRRCARRPFHEQRHFWTCKHNLSLIFSVLALGIYVEVRGRAHCIWTERCANVEENHVGNETYLEEKIYLIGGPSGKLKLLR